MICDGCGEYAFSVAACHETGGDRCYRCRVARPGEIEDLKAELYEQRVDEAPR